LDIESPIIDKEADVLQQPINGCNPEQKPRPGGWEPFVEAQGRKALASESFVKRMRVRGNES